jgi:hypothetical protein
VLAYVLESYGDAGGAVMRVWLDYAGAFRTL